MQYPSSMRDVSSASKCSTTTTTRGLQELCAQVWHKLSFSAVLLTVAFAPFCCQAQVTLTLNALPFETPAEDGIYVSGSFEGWTGGEPAYLLSETEPGLWEITFDPAPGLLEFKFTRGSWDTVEGNENGGFLPNRTLNYTGAPVSETMQVLSWEDLGGQTSTAAENVSIVSEDFYIPQLDRYRRIWIYLPPNYTTTDEHYKVLYMHDAQNVFDAATSFAGEWQVDESLNELFDAGDPGCIVVGIDNGGNHRIDEYTPWMNPTYGGGDGALYMDFLVETLKPYIDENYRTLPERQWTGLMGSSLGGLITFYGGIKHHDVFSRLGVFSPSYWFNDSCFTHAATTPHPEDMRMYTIAGELEGDSMVEDAEAMESTYDAAGYNSGEHLLQVHADGQHSEWYWAREFPAAYLWLWSGSPAAVLGNSQRVGVHVWPNPAGDSIQLSVSGAYAVKRTKLTDNTGRILATYAGVPESIDMRAYSGHLMVVLVLESGQVVVKRIVR